MPGKILQMINASKFARLISYAANMQTVLIQRKVFVGIGYLDVVRYHPMRCHGCLDPLSSIVDDDDDDESFISPRLDYSSSRAFFLRWYLRCAFHSNRLMGWQVLVLCVFWGER